MKKGVFFVSSVVLMAILFGIQSNRIEKDVEKTEKHKISTEVTKIENHNRHQATSSEMAIDRSADMAMDESAPDVESLRLQVPTWAEIEREYKNYRSDELAHEYKISTEKVHRMQLVEKANAGRLSAEETKSLLTEMRRQGVLTHLQLKEKVEIAKRKYL